MNKAIENGKLTGAGKIDIDNLLDEARRYKMKESVADDYFAEYWEAVSLEDILDQMIECDDTEADWGTTYDEFTALAFDIIFKNALKGAGYPIENRREVTESGMVRPYNQDMVVL
jgi:hypothetical protein